MRRVRRRALRGAATAIFAAIALALATPTPAHAHTPNPAACIHAWRQATPGSKWTALQRCKAAQRYHRLRHICSRPRPLVRGITVKGIRATTHQRRMLTRALNYSRRMRAPRSHQVAVVAGMTQESTATNLGYGDRDSVGILQLRAMHGDREWRLVPENSAGWFLRGARKLDPRGRASIATTRRPFRWGLIQRVQRSGHPFAYNRWIPEARRTVAAFLGACRR